MTAPQEPLKLTLEEAIAHLTQAELFLAREKEHNSWFWFVHDLMKDEEAVAKAFTWPEAVSTALGRPVVARDDAAHLEAELSKWWSAYVEVAGFLGMVSTDDTGRIGAVAGMEEVLAELEQREKDAAELRAAVEMWVDATDILEHDRSVALLNGHRDPEYIREDIAYIKRAEARLRAALAAIEGES